MGTGSNVTNPIEHAAVREPTIRRQFAARAFMVLSLITQDPRRAHTVRAEYCSGANQTYSPPCLKTRTCPSEWYLICLRKPQCLEPSFATRQVTVTTSPILQSSLCTPARLYVPGGFPWHPQVSTWPVFSSFTSNHVAVCGLTQSTFVSTPVADHSLSGLNSAVKE